ncbi:MAG: zf-TFIIB domain-containing protein [Methylococcaceae bacterium]
MNSKYDYSILGKEADRLCPQCNKPLQVINLDLNGSFLIERCVDCFGLFFDTGKIETLLETSVSNVFDSNWQHLDAINQDRYHGDKKVKYIKCPACHAFMSRVNFGYRSGVVIDRCTNHGIWLDSGEITHLMEWKKAGGQLLHDRQIATETMKRKNNSGTVSGYRLAQTDYFDNNLEAETFDKILSVISRIFR